MSEEKTQSSVLKAVSGLGDKVADLSESVSDLHEAMMAFSERVDYRFNQVDQRFERIEANMATKQQLNTLTDILQANNSISQRDATQVKNVSALPA